MKATKITKMRELVDEFRKAVVYPKGVNYWKCVGVQAKVWGIKKYGATFKLRILESESVRELHG